MKYHYTALAGALALGLTLTTASAAPPYSAADNAYDTASNYNDYGWGLSLLPNRGSGFGAWSVTQYGDPGGSYAHLNKNSPILNNGYAFGLASTDISDTIVATRAFTSSGPGDPTLVNQTLSLDLSCSGVGAGKFGLYLGNDDLDLTYNGDLNQFILGASGESMPTSITADQLAAGIHIALSVNDSSDRLWATPFTLEISATSDDSLLYYAVGNLDQQDYPLSSLTVWAEGTTGDGCFNNLSIQPTDVPEPASLALFGMAGSALVFRPRRRD